MTTTIDSTDAVDVGASAIHVELGNENPILKDGDDPMDAPCVTEISIPNDPANFPEGHHAYQQVMDSGMTGAELKDHIANAVLDQDGITHLPGHEAVMAVAHPLGIWRAHCTKGAKPTWVWSDNLEVARILSEYFECPMGRPADVEDTHYTSHNGITFGPGSGPLEGVPTDSLPDLEANITQNGRDMQSKMFGGGGTFYNGVSTTAPGATSYTLDGKGAPGSTSAYTGQRIIAGSSAVGCVWANVISNTNASPPVITVDRWYNAATPGGAAATTPVAGPWMVADGVAPSWFMGLSASTAGLSTPSTNTSLPGEITSAGGGLIRQICPWAHTASAATTTLTPVFTANGSDSLPVIIGSVGTFNSMVVADTTQTMFFNTLLGTTATLSSIGDQLTITQTITMT